MRGRNSKGDSPSIHAYIIFLIFVLSSKYKKTFFYRKVVNLQPKDRSILHRRLNEPRCEKTGLRGFRHVPTLTGLCSQRRWLEA